MLAALVSDDERKLPTLGRTLKQEMRRPAVRKPKLVNVQTLHA